MLEVLYTTGLIGVSVGLCLSLTGAGTIGNAPEGSGSAGAFYDFTVKDIAGNDVHLSKYKGNVCLVVNVASR